MYRMDKSALNVSQTSEVISIG